MTGPSRDNAADRLIGERWEGRFCGMARTLGKVFTPHQFKRPNQSAMFYGPGVGNGKSGWTLPDVTVWSAPGEHHEIKHKKRVPGRGWYGLEVYRLQALLHFARTTEQSVYYTIHDWEVAGAPNSRADWPNDIGHWFVADVAALARRHAKEMDSPTYYNGQIRQLPTRYWPADEFFRPLAEIWVPDAALVVDPPQSRFEQSMVVPAADAEDWPFVPEHLRTRPPGW